MHGMCVKLKSQYLLQMFVLVLLLLGLHVKGVKNDKNFLKKKCHSYFLLHCHAHP